MFITLQDLTAIINGTSRYNHSYDTVHVETLLVTDGPIPADKMWYIPNGSTVPPEVLAILSKEKLPMYPMSADKLLQGIDDVKAQAEAGNLTEVIKDAARLLQMSILKKTSLTPVPGATNTYLLAYDYKLFPLQGTPNTFEFSVMLPFDGLELQPQKQVMATIITPVNCNIDTVVTGGFDPNTHREIAPEVVTTIPNTNRKIVSFMYQNDPEFVIRYSLV